MKFTILSSDATIISSISSLLQTVLGGQTECLIDSIDFGPEKLSESVEDSKKSSTKRIFEAEHDDSDFYVSVSIGKEYEFDGVYGFVFACVSDSTKNKFGFGYSPKFIIPDGNTSECTNIIDTITGGFYNMKKFISEAVMSALIPLHFYATELPKNAPKELVKFADKIDPIQRNQLADQLCNLDFTKQKIFDAGKTSGELEEIELAELDDCQEDVMVNGLDALRFGEVAVVIMAGGQGSRLRAPIPKAMMEIEIPSKMTLLEVQLRRIKKLQTMLESYGQNPKPIPVYILTSESTHSPIASYLMMKENFGLEHVMLVKQKQLPARTPEGNFVLSDFGKVCAAPNGNGAVFSALSESGALKQMKELGVRYVDIHPIDNALARPADPYFVGAMIYEGGDAAIKVIKKLPKERMGTLCKKDGKVVIIEYSEIPEGKEELYPYGNTALQLYSIEIIELVAEKQLPYHVANKKEMIINEKGEKELGAVQKFERFIFDALEYCENVVVVECVREEEFAPIKNSSGSPTDSPETARDLILNLHKKWAELNDITLEGDGALEFLPETTYAGEGLEKFFGSTITTPMIL